MNNPTLLNTLVSTPWVLLTAAAFWTALVLVAGYSAQQRWRGKPDQPTLRAIKASIGLPLYGYLVVLLVLGTAAATTSMLTDNRPLTAFAAAAAGVATAVFGAWMGFAWLTARPRLEWAFAVTLTGVTSWLVLAPPLALLEPLAIGGVTASERRVLEHFANSWNDTEQRARGAALAVSAANAQRYDLAFALLDLGVDAQTRAAIAEASANAGPAGQYRAFLRNDLLNADESADLLRHAANDGLPTAQYHLALLHLGNEQIGQRDVRAAFGLLRDAANANYLPAIETLAIETARGVFEPASIDESTLWEQRAADASRTVSDPLPANRQPPGNWRQRAARLRSRWKSVEAGDHRSQIELAIDVASAAHGSPTLIDHAVAILTPAAQQGDSLAQFRIATTLATRRPPTLESEAAARRWLTAAADAGFDPARATLTNAYRNGAYGFAIDPARAAMYEREPDPLDSAREKIIRQAEWGNVDAQFAIIRRVLARSYSLIEEDDVLLWLNEQVGVGHRGAMVELGKLRMSGSRHGTIARDAAVARQLLEASLEAGGTVIYRSVLTEEPFAYRKKDVQALLDQIDG